MSDNPVDLLHDLLKKAAGQVDKAELEGFEQGYATALACLQIGRDIDSDHDYIHQVNLQKWAHDVRSRRKNGTLNRRRYAAY